MILKTLPEIRRFIQNWYHIKNDADKLKEYLSYVTSFSYSVIKKPVDYFHVYPGICFETKTLYLFLIDEKMDEDHEFTCIIQCKAAMDVLACDADTLPGQEAVDIIHNWQTKKDKWIEEKANTESGIFLAFRMPAAYLIEGQEYQTFFSLKPLLSDSDGSNIIQDYEADLVTMKKNFYDVVRPVPPFGQINFNLLYNNHEPCFIS